MEYSALFKCGLLSDAVVDYKPAPWQTDAEAFSPRRHESLPSTVDELSLIIPNSTSSPQELANSVASGDSSSFYFTVRKRASKEHRSFLSLDLAESQSLRSASLKKGNMQDTRHRLKQSRALNISTTAPTSSFMVMFSPPPLSSPRSAKSSPGSPNGKRPVHFGLPTSPTASIISQRRTSVSTEKDYGPAIRLPPPHPPLPQPIPRRELSPMRFAAPSPPPILNSHFDSYSVRSIASNDVLSRTSTVSSSYRRAQRREALKHLEGRTADGAIGRRINPRLSQNFMFLSDDDEEEEEEEVRAPLGKEINVIVEEVSEMKADMEEAWKRIIRGNTAEFSWYDGTPQPSPFPTSSMNPMVDDVSSNIDEIFGLHPSSYAPSPAPRSPNDKPRESKRSRRSKSPSSLLQPIPQHAAPLPTVPSSSRSSSRLRTPSSTRSESHSPSITTSQFLPLPSSSADSRASPAPIYPRFNETHGIRVRTVSDVGSNKSHNQLLNSEARARALRKGSPTVTPATHAPRVSSKSRPRFLDEEPSFIDMRDEPPDSDSRTDSWNSLLEVSCAA